MSLFWLWLMLLMFDVVSMFSAVVGCFVCGVVCFGWLLVWILLLWGCGLMCCYDAG